MAKYWPQSCLKRNGCSLELREKKYERRILGIRGKVVLLVRKYCLQSASCPSEVQRTLQNIATLRSLRSTRVQHAAGTVLLTRWFIITEIHPCVSGAIIAMIWWNYFDMRVRLHSCEFYCVLLYILYCFFSFYLYCLSVCLYVSCVCLWALLPDIK